MTRYGLVGKKLTHSFSKEIHSKLADYNYELIELSEDGVKTFFEEKSFAAVNVTIPYKQTVIPFLDFISEKAKKIGAVNTVVNKNGKLYGYNTDYYGMKALIEKTGVDLKGEKVLILGTGGTSKTARVLAEDLGAREILIVSRTKSENHITYQEAATLHSDANVIINTTPAGMYPDCDKTPIDISGFSALEGVIDAVYNPLRTNLVLDAKARGIKAEGGLYMLVMQAIVAVEKFLNTEISKEKADAIFSEILSQKENIVLTGMPSSGKTTIGKLLNLDGFTFYDSDKEIEKRCGCAIKDLINQKGEKFFRDLESQVIKELSLENGRIIATGGGAVLRNENITALKRNGKIFFIDADINRLKTTADRPLSDSKEKLKELYEKRIDIYKYTADVIVPDTTINDEAEYILKARKELLV